MHFFYALFMLICLLAVHAWRHRSFYRQPVKYVGINRRNRRRIKRGEAIAVSQNNEIKIVGRKAKKR